MWDKMLWENNIHFLLSIPKPKTVAKCYWNCFSGDKFPSFSILLSLFLSLFWFINHELINKVMKLLVSSTVNSGVSKNLSWNWKWNFSLIYVQEICIIQLLIERLRVSERNYGKLKLKKYNNKFKVESSLKTIETGNPLCNNKAENHFYFQFHIGREKFFIFRWFSNKFLQTFKHFLHWNKQKKFTWNYQTKDSQTVCHYFTKKTSSFF